MCGINGVWMFGASGAEAQIPRILRDMNTRVAHRGPDESGTYWEHAFGFGMTRLSIIDLSTGSQPISNEDESLRIVMNGEIYNYETLRASLLTQGHVFKTTSDTEVILHAYEAFGPEFLSRVRGMFAIAIFDSRSGRLFLARDRAGEKPLYYAMTEDAFVFASEMKSVLEAGVVQKRIDTTALAQYLQLSYIPAPLTILEGVRKLEAGHYMTVEADGRTEDIEYWDVNCDSALMITDYEQCKRKLREAVFSAVESCLVADVPVGTFLSGGIDSAIITGVAQAISTKPIETFTVGFRDRRYDESDRAAATALLHGTNHHVSYMDYDDMLRDIDAVIRNIDEPFADSSYLPTYHVSKFAREHVKAVLTGDAGDELFGGYEKYLIGYYAQRYQRIPRPIRGLLSRSVLALPDTTAATRKARKVVLNAEGSILEQRLNMMCPGVKADDLGRLLTVPVAGDSLQPIRDRYNRFAGCAEELDQALYADFKTVLEGDMLHKVDSAAMLASLEARTPLLDVGVVELAARIPGRFKISGREKKVILRDAFSDLIPPRLLHAGKRGFSVPLAEWFRGPMRGQLEVALDDEFMHDQGLFHTGYVRGLMDEHFSMKADRSTELWSLYVFQKWYARYFACPDVQAASAADN